jgi:hypothetical protein
VELLNERYGLSLPIDSTVAHKEHLFLELSGEVAAIEPSWRSRKVTPGVKPMAVASGGHRRIVMNTLRALGIADLFQAIVTAEDYHRGKAFPDPFLERPCALACLRKSAWSSKTRRPESPQPTRPECNPSSSAAFTHPGLAS